MYSNDFLLCVSSISNIQECRIRGQSIEYVLLSGCRPMGKAWTESLTKGVVLVDKFSGEGLGVRACISTMKLDEFVSMESPVPIRANTRSTHLMLANSAGTKQPI